MTRSSNGRVVGGGGGGVGNNSSNMMSNINHNNKYNMMAFMVVGVVCFFTGTLVATHAGIDQCVTKSVGNGLDADIELLAQKRLQELQAALPDCKQSATTLRNAQSIPNNYNNDSKNAFSFSEATSKYAVAMKEIPKQEFIDELDLGVPIDMPKEGDNNILLLYSKKSAMPSNTAQSALENCDYLNVLLTDHSASRNQCVAIVPQYESYHLQKFMRIDDNDKGKLNSSSKLQMVSRGYQSNGRNQFAPPSFEKHTLQHWDFLQSILQNYQVSLNDLKPILQKIAKQNTVIVMVCNFGQSELLMNFVCAAKSRNLDISAILVFATDQSTKELAESLGLAAFHDDKIFGEMPSEAAGHYGDRKFTAMMMAKVICVQMVAALNYDFLFQDVDIVWYKNPLDYFQKHTSFDIYFQDDGGHSIRYAPYSANSGFYFVKSNDRTLYFLTSLLQAGGDLILKTDSHQQALIAYLSEHASLYGLKVKVLSRDTIEFPGGYHFHQASGNYMRQLFAGTIEPYIFHMSWTLNKDNKLLFFRQMGEWYVQESCIHASVQDIGPDKDIPATCCAAEPLFSCHYRDKPSMKPCKESPPIDKNGKSFWK